MTFPIDVPTLTDGIVTLRAHGASDLEDIYEQCQDPESQRQTTVPVPFTWEHAHGFLEKVVPEGWDIGNEWAFAIEAVDDAGISRFAGTISLREEGERRAELAYGSHAGARGRGVLERAARLILEWGFTDKELHTVIWWANKGNWASRKLAWRLGFSFEGTVRRWLPQRGELHDAWVGSLLHDDERAPRHAWFDVPRLAGSCVVLRGHRADDATRVQEACADPRTQYWFDNMPNPYTLDDARTYLEGRIELRATAKGVGWAVADPRTDLLLANISIFDLKPGREAEIGYWTHPDARGRGVMTDACRLVLRHAFVPEDDGGLGLKRVMIYAAETNTASRRVIEANDFVEVGRERSGIRVGDGELVDTICYDMLVDEYDGRGG